MALPDPVFDLIDADLAGLSDEQVGQRLDRTLRALGYGTEQEPKAGPETADVLLGATGAGRGDPREQANADAARRWWEATDAVVASPADDPWRELAEFRRSGECQGRAVDAQLQRILDCAHREAKLIIVEASLEAKRIRDDARADAEKIRWQALHEAWTANEAALLRHKPRPSTIAAEPVSAHDC
ncbi:hypothetical protein [Paractinoplanes globisporus]|uniref:Uncharacterized protein n=1 Tax=Paractinoplanes globisporus TaxID=113565 RepID=A0ABW6WID5_9ACTN|nr:hypothetical protein [Actinoplanes globisporus]